MSLRGTCKTEINDETDLFSALESIYSKGKITINPTGGIVIGVSGLYGRAIFSKGPDGNYQLIYDKTDQHRLSDVIPQKQRDGTTVNRLAQEYSRIKVGRALKTIRGARLIADETDEDGNIRIRAKVRES